MGSGASRNEGSCGPAASPSVASAVSSAKTGAMHEAAAAPAANAEPATNERRLSVDAVFIMWSLLTSHSICQRFFFEQCAVSSGTGTHLGRMAPSRATAPNARHHSDASTARRHGWETDETPKGEDENCHTCQNPPTLRRKTGSEQSRIIQRTAEGGFAWRSSSKAAGHGCSVSPSSSRTRRWRASPAAAWSTRCLPRRCLWGASFR